jgi:hypothetical protein
MIWDASSSSFLGRPLSTETGAGLELSAAQYLLEDHRNNLQDRDNVLIFGGFDLKPSRRMTFYTQALIDELKYKELFSSWWGKNMQCKAEYRI